MEHAEQVEEKMEILVGDVRGKNAILLDDMIDTGETLTLAAKELDQAGAKAVYAIVSHGPFSRLPSPFSTLKHTTYSISLYLSFGVLTSYLDGINRTVVW
jgi:phosphoribosylpyrophosphate synthetase